MSGAVTDRASVGVEPGGVTRLEHTQALAPRSPIPPFREVYEENVELVVRTLRRTGVPASAIDDVAQEVFLAVHRALPTWEGRSSLRTWIYRVARNAALNHGRSARRRPDGAPTAGADEIAHGSADPEAIASTHQALAALQSLLDRIDEPKREVLALIDLEELSAPEVAELLAIPLNTVYSRLRLARAELERLLAEGDR
jgi:RNA polymerase sigma-70 factor (ECF subfamily)